MVKTTWKPKFAVGIWIFGKVADRFMVYREGDPLEKRFEKAASIEGVEGVEIGYPMDFKEEEFDRVKELFKEYKLQPVAVLADTFTDPLFMYGSYSSPKEEVRRKAVEITKKAMDFAEELGCNLINIWPGQDGYDYMFQVNYEKAWKNFIECIRECADYKPKVKIAIEYKLKEPRARIFIGCVGKALFLVNEVGRENVGVTLDIGHAFMASENPAESVALLGMKKKLFHVHMNDNDKTWDWDLIVGTCSFWDYLEFFLWLNLTGYDGWLSMDVYPYRVDPVKACTESVRNMKKILAVMEKVGVEKLKEIVEKGEIEETIKVIREAL